MIHASQAAVGYVNSTCEQSDFSVSALKCIAFNIVLSEPINVM